MYPRTPSATTKPANETSSSKYGELSDARAYPHATQLDTPMYTANHDTARLRSLKNSTIDTSMTAERPYSVAQSITEIELTTFRTAGLGERTENDKIAMLKTAESARTDEMIQTPTGRAGSSRLITAPSSSRLPPGSGAFSGTLGPSSRDDALGRTNTVGRVHSLPHCERRALQS